MRDSARSIVIFGVASLVAVAAGCVAMAQAGVGPSSWLRSVVAWVAGAALALLLARYGQPRSASIGAVVLATGALIATLFAPAVDGVHRWVDLGPLHINVAALLLPALIVALAAIGIARPMALVAACIAATVLLLQPDASQLTSFAVAASILLVRSGVKRGWKVVGLVAAVAFAIAGWTRPDTLQPVAEVEQIFTLCLAVSPLLALAAGVALAAAATAPLAFSSSADGAIALAAYFLCVSIAPFFGWFPVPLVGLGMSFPVGFWLGMGLLLVVNIRESAKVLPTARDPVAQHG